MQVCESDAIHVGGAYRKERNQSQTNTLREYHLDSIVSLDYTFFFTFTFYFNL